MKYRILRHCIFAKKSNFRYIKIIIAFQMEKVVLTEIILPGEMPTKRVQNFYSFRGISLAMLQGALQ